MAFLVDNTFQIVIEEHLACAVDMKVFFGLMTCFDISVDTR